MSKPRSEHPICAVLRELRETRGWTLADVERHTGGRWKAVVVGSYERGDRRPTVEAADELLALYGRQTGVMPLGYDLNSLLAELEDLRAMQRHVGNAVLAARNAEQRPTLREVQAA